VFGPGRDIGQATPQVESESRLESRAESGTSPVPVQFQSLEIRILADSLIEFTIPDKPNSRLQKYRLTEKGGQALQKHEGNRP